jgi:hypothetical protein
MTHIKIAALDNLEFKLPDDLEEVYIAQTTGGPIDHLIDMGNLRIHVYDKQSHRKIAHFCLTIKKADLTKLRNELREAYEQILIKVIKQKFGHEVTGLLNKQEEGGALPVLGNVTYDEVLSALPK